MRYKTKAGLSIVVFPLVLLWGAAPVADAAPKQPQLAETYQAVYDSRLATQVERGRNWAVRLGGNTSFKLGALNGGYLGLGYHWKIYGLDIKGAFGSGQYSAFHPDPSVYDLSNADYPSVSDEGSELNRPRGKKDPWSYWLVMPGFGIQGRAFPKFLPLMSQRARVAIGYGGFKDSKNKLNFSAMTYTVEAGLQYQLGKNSPWCIDVGGEWTAGRLLASNRKGLRQARQLPLSYLLLSGGVSYWF